MFVSVFDIFKISVGPSSSHTMGPMLAASGFAELVQAQWRAEFAECAICCRLYGSLAYTGVGHGTHAAVLAGWLGFVPETFDPEAAHKAVEAMRAEGALRLANGQNLRFEADKAIIADRETRLPLHPNGMRFELQDKPGEPVFGETYYSVGGGFVLTEAEMGTRDSVVLADDDVPYPFANADEMLAMGEKSGLGISAMKRANETARQEAEQVDARLLHVWDVMDRSIARGLAGEGELPGGLKVQRRARGVAERMRAATGHNDAPLHTAVDWLSAYAMAVNEENAMGGQVVTAPTNGAAGVIPAVIRYYLDHVPGADRAQVPEMLLTASAIGGLIKFNASISGAEVGCQGEVGSASAMAAAALCCALGGSNAQIENAAEIALEHHLGMTCDPIRGLVQVPCIERNGMGAVKAVAAASLALAGDGRHIVSLDACIETMRQTGRDMDERYKETSLAGLSVSVPEC